MIGQLRSRVGLYHAVVTPDALGGAQTTWQLHRAAWADIRPAAPRSAYEQGRETITMSYRAVIRFEDNFPKRVRMMWGDRILRVLAASDPDGRRERLHLICEEERQ